MAEQKCHLQIHPLSQGHFKALPLLTPSTTVLVDSPFFLQPANETSPGPKLSQIREESTDELSEFPLTRLPTELQLRVLWHCLVSSLPILNAGVPRNEQIALLRDETRGQRRINPSIIFTCKAYYHEGIKLLYTNNHFSYTCKQLPSNWPSGVGKGISHVEKLILRPLCDRESAFSRKAAIIPMYWLRFFSRLKSLRIDFCGANLGYQHTWDEDQDSMKLMVEALDNLIVARMNTHSSGNGLSELILTGLPECDLGLFVLRSMSMLLGVNGKIGVGTGSEGKTYVVDPSEYYSAEEQMAMILRNDHPLLEPMQPQIHWIRMQDVGALIRRAASDPYSEWLSGDLSLVSDRLN